MHSAARHTILLVEANPSLRRMIALGLRYRGLDVIEAASPDEIYDTSKRRPDLILLDIDGEVGNGAALLAEIQACLLLASLPIVLLTWDASMPLRTGEEYRLVQYTSLAKPFDARALHAVIESRLSPENMPGQQEQSRASIQPGRDDSSPNNLRASSPAAPSLCPMLTAAGLMLAFIGLMLQIAITAIGLLIVIAALLWWTLGTKQENIAVAR
jgi:DNA-binding response OmpR family regulator